MPKRGLSLHGFMTEAEAVRYLEEAVVLNEASAAQTWAEARDKLGEPMERAGTPEVLPLPEGCLPHARELAGTPWFINAIGQPYAFQLVEIDPLLAFQFSVSIDHSEALVEGLAADSTLEAVCARTLPLEKASPAVRVSPQGNSVALISSDLNFRVFGLDKLAVNEQAGMEILGAIVGVAAPVVQVARFNGRYYLRNGFHRAVGLRSLGLTHVPCVVIELDRFEDLAGIQGGFFHQGLLESDNPPTVGHFTQGRAMPVALRGVNRIVTVTVTDHVILEAP